MIRIVRSATPNYLVNYKKWGMEVFKKKSKNPAYEINWKQYKKQKIYPRLLVSLKQMTKNHCSYCDISPLWASGPSIDHFRPKADFPKLAYCWHNLFFCCTSCQKWGNKFDKKLLKPDKLDYRFERYFILKTNNSRIFIEANPHNNQTDIDRAEYTIEVFELNKFGKPIDRYKELVKFNPNNGLTIDDYSFRYLFS